MIEFERAKLLSLKAHSELNDWDIERKRYPSTIIAVAS